MFSDDFPKLCSLLRPLDILQTSELLRAKRPNTMLRLYNVSSVHAPGKIGMPKSPAVAARSPHPKWLDEFYRPS